MSIISIDSLCTKSKDSGQLNKYIDSDEAKQFSKRATQLNLWTAGCTNVESGGAGQRIGTGKQKFLFTYQTFERRQLAPKDYQIKHNEKWEQIKKHDAKSNMPKNCTLRLGSMRFGHWTEDKILRRPIQAVERTKP